MRRLPSKMRAAYGRGQSRILADTSQRSNRNAIANGGWQRGEGGKSIYQQGMDKYFDGLPLPHNPDRQLEYGFKAGLATDIKFADQLLAAGKCARKAEERIQCGLQLMANDYRAA